MKSRSLLSKPILPVLLSVHPVLRVVVLLAVFCLPVRAQIIGDIKHEAFRQKVLLTYTVNGLAGNQHLEVNLYCSDDAFQTGLVSLSGNGSGDRVQGNGQKTIIWDVLKDRPKLTGKVSFEIRALVINDMHASASASAGPAVITAASPEEKKSAVYAEMSSALGSFIIEAKDLVIAFRKSNDAMFEDNLMLRQLTDAVINYNTAFNKLNNDRMSYEKEVLLYWNNEALYNDVRYLFDYALGELHSANVLELNGALSTINDINLGKIAGRKNERDAKEKVLMSIYQNTGQLDKRIQELERRANRILYTLSNR
jgi:hypothetical protein